MTTCTRPGCGGTIEDGYCTVCGMAPEAVANLEAIKRIPVFGAKGEHLTLAEVTTIEVKQGFAEARLVYKAALTGLELGAVLLRLEKPEAAAEEILSAADIFMSLGIGREASASVLLLRRAAEQRIVDAALIDYVAGVYFLLPADQLPGFFPGHEAGVTRIHAKHGIVAAVVGVVLILAGWWTGRR